MIDEKKLIAEIWKKSYGSWSTKWDASGIVNTIESQPKVGEWIPVSERLPEEPMFSWQGYIVQAKNVEEPYSAYWDGEKWTDSEDIERTNSIAWMPLPERYKPPKQIMPQWKKDIINKFTEVK